MSKTRQMKNPDNTTPLNPPPFFLEGMERVRERVPELFPRLIQTLMIDLADEGINPNKALDDIDIIYEASRSGPIFTDEERAAWAQEDSGQP